MPSVTPPHQSSPRLRRSTNGERGNSDAPRAASQRPEDKPPTPRPAPAPPLEGAGRQLPKPPQMRPQQPAQPLAGGQVIPPLPRAQPVPPAQPAAPPPPPPMARPTRRANAIPPAVPTPVGAPIPSAQGLPALPIAPVAPERRTRRNPRVLAAFAYALPIVPAALMIARERRNGFVRLHALQALVFYVLVALAQSALYALAVVTGNLSHSLPLAVGLFCVFFALFGGLGLLALRTWLRLLRDALAGRRSWFPLISWPADRLDRLFARGVGASARGRAGKN